jgi:pullulanase/glycogen debranching enzyme
MHLSVQVGAFPHYGNRWSEWNGRFRDTVRNFIKVRYHTCAASDGAKTAHRHCSQQLVNHSTHGN